VYVITRRQNAVRDARLLLLLGGSDVRSFRTSFRLGSCLGFRLGGRIAISPLANNLRLETRRVSSVYLATIGVEKSSCKRSPCMFKPS